MANKLNKTSTPNISLTYLHFRRSPMERMIPTPPKNFKLPDSGTNNPCLYSVSKEMVVIRIAVIRVK